MTKFDFITTRNPYGEKAYGYVYKFTNLNSGRSYIGQHQSSSYDEKYTGSGSLWKKVKNHYKWTKAWSTPDIKIEVLCWCLNQQELNRMERFYILSERTIVRSCGYNYQIGGECCADNGKIPEIVEKNRQSNIEYWNSEEGKAKRAELTRQRKEWFDSEEGLLYREERSVWYKNFFKTEEGIEARKRMAEGQVRFNNTEYGKQLRRINAEKRKEWFQSEEGIEYRKQASEQAKIRCSSPEFREFISRRQKQFYATEKGMEVRKRTSERNRVRMNSDETIEFRKQCSKRLKALIQTEEWRNHQSQCMAGKGNSMFGKFKYGTVYAYNCQSGEYAGEFHNWFEICQLVGRNFEAPNERKAVRTNVSHALDRKKNQTRAYGYDWFVEKR